MVTRHPKYAELSPRAVKVHGVLWGLGDGVTIDDQGRQVVRCRIRIPDWINENGEYKLGLASRCGYKSRRAVELALAELEAVGWLERDRTGRGNRFTIIVPIERRADAADAHDDDDDDTPDDASDAHVQDTTEAHSDASDAHVWGVSTHQTLCPKPNNQTTNTNTPAAAAGGGGGVFELLDDLGIRNPTRAELASEPRLTREVIDHIAREVRRTGGRTGAIVTALREGTTIEAAERAVASARERHERQEAERQAAAEAERQRQAEADERKRHERREYTRSWLSRLLEKPDGVAYVDSLHNKIITEQGGERFTATDPTADTDDAAELRELMYARAYWARCASLLRATDDELVEAFDRMFGCKTPASIIRADIEARRLDYTRLGLILDAIARATTTTTAS